MDLVEETSDRMLEVSPREKTYTLRFLQRLFDKSSPEQIDTVIPRSIPKQHPQPINNSSGIFKTSSSGYFSPKREYVPVVRSENAWIGHKLGKEQSESEILLGKLRSDLNKLSPENEDTIITRVCEGATTDNLESIMSMIFEKIARETKFHISYANLCAKIYTIFPLITQLISKHYERCHDLKISDDDEDDTIALAIKNRAGTIEFARELLRRKLVAIASLVKVVDNLLLSAETGEYNICHLCDLLILAIPEIKNKKSLKSFAPYLKKLSSTSSKSTRVKLKIEGAIEIGKTYKLI